MRGLLTPKLAEIEAAGLSVSRLAAYVITSAKTFKKEAQDEAELQGLLAMLTLLVVLITG